MRPNILTTTFITVLLPCTSVLAASQLGQSTQKGSLLIFPRVEALSPNNGASGFSDTYINITNDWLYPVNVQCYWNTTEQHGSLGEVGLGGNTANNGKAKLARMAIRHNHNMGFSFRLTKHQPVSFWAGDLSEFANGVIPKTSPVKLFSILATPQFNQFPDGHIAHRGELRCWAVDATGSQEVHHNHLAGKATIATFVKNSTKQPVTPTAAGQAHEYNAWAFQAYYRGSTHQQYTGRAMPTPGQLKLDGKEYDFCPSVLQGQFTPTGANFFKYGKTHNQISISHCTADLRQDHTSAITRLSYTVYNANKMKFSGAGECIGAWHESDVGNRFPHFNYRTLKTDTAYFLVRSQASKVCNQNPRNYRAEKDIVASGIVGILVHDVDGALQASSNLVGLGDGTDAAAPVASTIYWDNSLDSLGKK
jgi:hypothetical protein